MVPVPALDNFENLLCQVSDSKLLCPIFTDLLKFYSALCFSPIYIDNLCIYLKHNDDVDGQRTFCMHECASNTLNSPGDYC